MNAKFQAAALSWFRAAASAAVALYLTGVTDPKLSRTLAQAFVTPSIDWKSEWIVYLN